MGYKFRRCAFSLCLLAALNSPAMVCPAPLTILYKITCKAHRSSNFAFGSGTLTESRHFRSAETDPPHCELRTTRAATLTMNAFAGKTVKLKKTFATDWSHDTKNNIDTFGSSDATLTVGPTVDNLLIDGVHYPTDCEISN